LAPRLIWYDLGVFAMNIFWKKQPLVAMYTPVTQNRKVCRRKGSLRSGLVLACAILLSGPVTGQSDETTRALQRLTDERQILTAELDQFQKTLDLLQPDGSPPEQSANPVVRTLVAEAVTLKERLIAITEQEVTLLQEQIIAAKITAEPPTDSVAIVADSPESEHAIESKPLRSYRINDSLEHEAENVKRLHGLLQNYYTELQESARILPTAEELALRKLAQRDAETLDKIPFSVDKVRLNGSEGSTALASITQRLTDSRVPESRRDIAPICHIKTRLFDTLVGSENRSLRPVGKNHYIARVRLQPGDTTVTILSDQWELRLPQHGYARDYLITLYSPVDASPELHVFAVDDLLTAERPHIPAWLPTELGLKTKAG
jgi:hypothetical protein